MKKIFDAFFTFIRLSLKKIIYGKKIRFNKIMLLSNKAKLKIIGKRAFIQLGYKNNIKEGCRLDAIGGSIQLEDYVFINRNGIIVAMSDIRIGSHTSIGPNVVIYDHDHNYKGNDDEKYLSEPIIIGKNVWIGANCTILKGVKIGDNAVIAAGTLVCSDVPENTLVYQKRDNIYKKN